MTLHRELPSRRTPERQQPAGKKTADTERAAEVGAGMSNADGFAEQIIRTGAAVRLGTLLTTPPEGTLYHVPDRGGLSIVALPTTSLSREEIAGLLAYRFAQYLRVGFVDREIVCAQGMRTVPASGIAPGDVHVVVGLPTTGEVLCYVVIRQAPTAPAGCRLRSSERQLFPVELVHGAGVYNRLPILPDLAIGKIRELGRFVRNHLSEADRNLTTRAAVETGVAVFRLLVGPLRLHVDAVIGDLEEQVAKRNLDFFHVPLVLIRGTVPYASNANYLNPRYQLHTVYPFAVLTSDIETARPRLEKIESALAKPGKTGLLALLKLRSQGGAAESMLHRDGQASDVDELIPVQTQMSMTQRGLLLEQGQWLRQLAPFSDLSLAEAATLCTVMHHVDIPAGHVIARNGEAADAMFVVESGQASLELIHDDAERERIGTVGPGQCCGHVAVLTGGTQPVDVVASTDMTLLLLSKAHHDTYLAELGGVEQRLRLDALRQLAEIDLRRRLRRASQPPVGGCGCGDAGACRNDHGPAAERLGTDQLSGTA